MRQRYVQIGGELVPADEQTARLRYVIDDIPAFKANTGAHIEGIGVPVRDFTNLKKGWERTWLTRISSHLRTVQ